MKAKIINSSIVYSDKRFDGSFHLSNSVLFERAIRKHKYKELHELTNEIFTAGRSKRVYVDNSKLGYPYLSNTNVVSQNPMSNYKYVSKKFSFDAKSFLKEGMIVTGRVGAIGQTAYISKEYEEKEAMGSDNIVRIVANKNILSGYLYAFLASKYGNTFFWKIASGGVQPYISEPALNDMPIPIFPKEKQEEIHQLIVDAANLRVEANKMLNEAQKKLKIKTNLKDLTSEDYEYYGTHQKGRKVSTFKRSIKELSNISINAFNYSKKIETIENRIKKNNKTIPLSEALDINQFFSTGSFPRIEINSPKAIRLINQSDIFNIKIEGKKISKRKVKVNKLVTYGEVLIAGVGTLGENETFCRTIFANEELEGELVSGEFIRMKTNSKIPSGYLFAWLSSDYGFRMIRKTQTGTKLCRPIQVLLANLPVPVLDKPTMKNIDLKVKKAHTLRYDALQKENQAISLIEKEIDLWQN